MGITDDNERYSLVAADAIEVALRLAQSEMPEGSASRMLLLIIGLAAAYLGRLGVNSQDVLTITWGMYEKGSKLAPLSGDRTNNHARN